MLRQLIRQLVLEEIIPNPGARLRVVEPMALKQADSESVDSFGHGEMLIFVSSDGITAVVRSPSRGKRYQISIGILRKATAPYAADISQTPAQTKKKPVPSDLRGKRMY